MEKVEIDILSICSPTQTHEKIFNEACERGVKKIWLEKPSSINSTSIQRMIDKKNKHGIDVYVNYFRRYEKGFIKVKKELAEEALIVAGDLNLRWNDPEDRSLLESFKKDLGLTDPLKGMQAEKGWQILDYILYRNGKSTNLEVLKKGEDLTFQKNLKPLSDHPALYIKLLIN